MISALILICTVLTVVGMLVKNRENFMIRPNATGPKVPNVKLFLKMGVIFFTGLIISMFQPITLMRVEAGHVGIKVNLTGGDRGVSKYEYKTGWTFYDSWFEQMLQFPTYQQHIEYDTIQVISKGGFMADIRPSFNYSLIPDAVGDMYQNLRKPVNEIEQGWLKNAIYSSVNDVSNRWAIDSIFNHRQEFEASIIYECNQRVSKWFIISQLRSNIVPPKSLQDAINAKTNSIQKVQLQENDKKVEIAKGETNLATAKYEALSLITKARGDSASAVITAQGEAQAIKAKQLTLTPLYIEFMRIQQWDGHTPTTVLGGTTPLLNIK